MAENTIYLKNLFKLHDQHNNLHSGSCGQVMFSFVGCLVQLETPGNGTNLAGLCTCVRKEERVINYTRKPVERV